MIDCDRRKKEYLCHYQALFSNFIPINSIKYKTGNKFATEINLKMFKSKAVVKKKTTNISHIEKCDNL